MPRLFALLAACTTPTGGGGDDDDSAIDDDDAADDDDATDEPFSCDGITPSVTDLTPDELSEMLEDKDFEFINVHIPYAGYIDGTDAHVAFNDVDAIEAALGNDITTKAVLYCLTGPMSIQATEALVDRGYCRIYDLPYGMVGWQNSGYPLED